MGRAAHVRGEALCDDDDDVDYWRRMRCKGLS